MRVTIEKEKPIEDRKGEERIVKRFLFTPLQIDDEVRWLEFVSILQRVVVHGIWVGSMPIPVYEWENIKFVDKNKAVE